MARRGENIYKRKDDRWEARCRIGIGPNGKPRYKSIYAHSYLECKEKLKTFIQNQNQDIRIFGCYSQCGDDFTTIAYQWLAHMQMTIKPATYSNYRYLLEQYVIPYWGQVSITKISTSMAEYWIHVLKNRNRKLKNPNSEAKRKLSESTIEIILQIFKSVFRFAKKRYRIRDPVRDLRISRKYVMDPNKVLTHQEWEKLKKTVYQINGAEGIRIAMYTGMRIGEICALKKEDINFEEGIIIIRRTAERVRVSEEERKDGRKTKLILNTPKSVNSFRMIPIPYILEPTLHQLCDARKQGEYIISTDGRKPLDPRTMQERFQKVLRKGYIRHVNFHAIRHTFATWCVEKHMDIKVLSEILGHSSVKITLDRYVHSSMEFKKEQINMVYEMK